MQLSHIVKQENIVEKFEIDIIHLIDVDKKALAVLSLLAIIKKDNIIDRDKESSFEKYIGMKKSTLLNQIEFVLADFLAGILLYTITTVENKVGKDCVKEITQDYVDGFADKKDTIRIWDSISQRLEQIKKENTSPVEKDIVALSSSETPSEQMLNIFKQAILTYRIVDFITSDPTVLLDADLPDEVDSFVDTIKVHILHQFIHFQKEDTYKKISEFNQTLNGYKMYLGFNLEFIGEYYVPSAIFGNKDAEWFMDFEKTTMDSRKAINSLYGEICDGDTLSVY